MTALVKQALDHARQATHEPREYLDRHPPVETLALGLLELHEENGRLRLALAEAVNTLREHVTLRNDYEATIRKLGKLVTP